jgi:sulfur carrier protein ThiS
MPSVTLKLYAELRRYSDGKPSVEFQFDDRMTVAQVLQQLSIPIEQTRLIFVDGRATRPDHILQGGQTVEVFSAVGGG